MLPKYNQFYVHIPTKLLVSVVVLQFLHGQTDIQTNGAKNKTKITV